MSGAFVWIYCIVWNFTLLMGAGWAVFVKDRSPWWFLMVVILHASPRDERISS